jgi:hypothetical protein
MVGRCACMVRTWLTISVVSYETQIYNEKEFLVHTPSILHGGTLMAIGSLWWALIIVICKKIGHPKVLSLGNSMLWNQNYNLRDAVVDPKCWNSGFNLSLSKTIWGGVNRHNKNELMKPYFFNYKILIKWKGFSKKWICRVTNKKLKN